MHAIAAAASAKHERSEAFDVLKEELKTYLGEELPEEDKPLIGHYFGELQYHVVRDMILNLRRSSMAVVQMTFAHFIWKPIYYLAHMARLCLHVVKHNHLQLLP